MVTLAKHLFRAAQEKVLFVALSAAAVVVGGIILYMVFGIPPGGSGSPHNAFLPDGQTRSPTPVEVGSTTPSVATQSPQPLYLADDNGDYPISAVKPTYGVAMFAGRTFYKSVSFDFRSCCTTFLAYTDFDISGAAYMSFSTKVGLDDQSTCRVRVSVMAGGKVLFPAVDLSPQSRSTSFQGAIAKGPIRLQAVPFGANTEFSSCVVIWGDPMVTG